MIMRIATALLFGVFMLPAAAWAQEKNKDDKKQEEKKEEPRKDVVVNDELIAADLKDKIRTQSYCKTYTYKMVEGRNYVIDARSPWDNYLRLENPAGEQVAADDDGGGFPNARINYRAVKTGEYTIIVTTFSGGVTGKFTLTVKEVVPAEVKRVGAKAGEAIHLKLTNGKVVVGSELTNNDAMFQNKIHKLFTFDAEEGKSYQIDHMAKFDCYLYLENPNGNIIAQDDDGGEGLNSRIRFKADKAGKYRILATSLGGRSVGDFTLQVEQMDAAPKDPNKDGAKKEGVKEGARRDPASPALRVQPRIQILPAPPRQK